METTVATLYDLDATARTMKALHGNCWRLAGPHNSTARQTLMLAITGEKRPKAKCGVTALTTELHARLEPKGNCQPSREDWVRDWADRCTDTID